MAGESEMPRLIDPGATSNSWPNLLDSTPSRSQGDHPIRSAFKYGTNGSGIWMLPSAC